MTAFQNTAVVKKFDSYPAKARATMLMLRQLIFDTAAASEGVGEIEETLKWGEPAYLTSQTKSGTTIRMDWKPATPSQCAIYFHCRTNLVERFRAMFPNEFQFAGNRAIVFETGGPIPKDQVAYCIGEALTYHRTRARNRGLSCQD